MKKLLGVLFAFTLIAALATGVFAATEIAHYTFDDAENLGADSVGTYNGTNTGVTATEGVKGSAGLFDGASTIEVETELMLPQFSLSVWVRADDASGDFHSVMAVSQWALPGTVHLNLMGQAGSVPMGFEVGVYDGGLDDAARRTPGDVVLGEWTNWIVVYDTEARTINQYINGKLAATVEGAGDCEPVDLFDFFIGSWDGGRYFTGAIDELVIYSTALTDAEIAEISASPAEAAPVEEAPAEEAPAETEAPAEEAPTETEAPVEEAPVTTAPQTADIAVIAVIAAVMSLGTAIVSKKH